MYSILEPLLLLVLLAQTAVSKGAAVGYGTCKHACTCLSTELPSQVFPKTDGAYYWAQQAAEVQPACYVRPLNSSHVATVIYTSKKYQCPFAIRGGGHSDIPGASNSPGGITLDLGALTEITVNKAQDVTELGPGLSWGDVYNALDPMNLTVIGGRESSVGVAGLTLGGGISYLSGLHGFACDNVKSFEVVLASGKTVIASHNSQYSDIFHALRGGGNNFGVVTKFNVDTYEQGLMNGGLVVWSDSPAVESGLIDAFTAYAESAESAPAASVFNSIEYSPTTKSYSWAAGLSYADVNVPPSVFSGFYTATLNKSVLLSTVGPTTQGNQAAALDESQPSGLRNQFHTATFRLDKRLQARMVQIFREEAERVGNMPLVNPDSFAPNLAFQPLTQPFLAQQAKRGGNVLGLAPTKAPLMLLSISWPWFSPKDDAVVLGGMNRTVNRSIAAAKKMGLFDDFLYMNYAAAGTYPIASYGPANRAFLKQVSKKYDPTGVFQKLVPGGFKLV